MDVQHPLKYKDQSGPQTNSGVAKAYLVGILQHAYSGEMGAAYAYRGHWKSLKYLPEISGIQLIETEEWTHRSTVGQMLAELGAKPKRLNEVKCWLIGRAIGIACHLAGWFMPMYFAGLVESTNWVEYDNAAAFALELGLPEFENELLAMSRVEREHELFFLRVIAGHRLLGLFCKIFNWGRREVLEEAC